MPERRNQKLTPYHKMLLGVAIVFTLLVLWHGTRGNSPKGGQQIGWTDNGPLSTSDTRLGSGPITRSA